MMDAHYHWTHLLIDLDETLLDFRQSEATALQDTLLAFGISTTPDAIQAYHEANDALWRQLEQGTITQSVLRWLRFQHFLERMGLDASHAHAMSDAYVQFFARQGHLLEGAMDFLHMLHGRMTICALTNGISAIQRGRIVSSGIAPFIDYVVISDEEGVSKPDPAIFRIAMERTGCTDSSRAVMLGDSLTSDIAGANAAGIASIHLCAGGSMDHSATFQVRTLQEAAALLSKYALTVS